MTEQEYLGLRLLELRQQHAITHKVSVPESQRLIKITQLIEAARIKP